MSNQLINILIRADGADQTASQFNNVAGTADNLDGRMKSLAGTMAAGFAVAGLTMMTNSLIAAGTEAGNTDAKLAAMLKVRGQSGAAESLKGLSTEMSKLTGQDDDLFNDASAHLLSFGLNAEQIKKIMPGIAGQANTMGQSVDSVADSFGRAFASGNVGALAKSGVVLTEADKAAVDYAKGISEAAGQQELFNRVLASYTNYAAHAGDGTTDAAKKMGYFSTLVGNAQETIGQGAGDMRASWMSALTPMMESLTTTHSGILTFIGGVMEMGTVVGNVATPIVGVISFLREWQMATNIQKIANAELTASNAAAATSAEAVAVAEGEAAVATGAAGAAAAGAAPKIGLMAMMQTEFAAASLGAKLGVIGLAAAGVAIAGIIYKLGQMIGLLDKSGSMIDEVGRGWKVITGNTKGAETDIGVKMYDKQMKELDDAERKMRTDGKSEDEIQKFRVKREIEIETHWTGEFTRHGDDELANEHSKKLGQLKQQQAGGAAMPMTPTMPSVDDDAASGPMTKDQKKAAKEQEAAIKKASAEAERAQEKALKDAKDLRDARREAADILFNANTSGNADVMVAGMRAASTRFERQEKAATESKVKALEAGMEGMRRGDKEAAREQIEALKKASDARINNEKAATAARIEREQASAEYQAELKSNALNSDMTAPERVKAKANLDAAAIKYRNKLNVIDINQKAATEDVKDVKYTNPYATNKLSGGRLGFNTSGFNGAPAMPSSTTAERMETYVAQVQSYKALPNGDYQVQFAPVTLPNNGIQQASKRLR